MTGKAPHGPGTPISQAFSEPDASAMWSRNRMASRAPRWERQTRRQQSRRARMQPTLRIRCSQMPADTWLRYDFVQCLRACRCLYPRPPRNLAPRLYMALTRQRRDNTVLIPRRPRNVRCRRGIAYGNAFAYGNALDASPAPYVSVAYPALDLLLRISRGGALLYQETRVI